MIFLDTNIFLRHLVREDDPVLRVMCDSATRLFEQAERNEIEITTSEVVLHEVIYVLASKRHYNLDAEQIADTIRPLLQLPALRLPRGDKTTYQEALDLFAANPQLGFADAVIAVRSLRSGIELASFGRHFDRVPGLKRLPLATAD